MTQLMKMAKFYDGDNNIIDFKIHIVCIDDKHSQDIDLCLIEVRLPVANADKTLKDLTLQRQRPHYGTSGRLARCNRTNTDSYAVQVIVFQAFFSTVTYAHADFFAAAHQLSATFLVCVARLVSFDKAMLQLVSSYRLNWRMNQA